MEGMMDPETTSESTGAPADPREALLAAALSHVPFDGWSEATFRAAIRDTGIEPGLARSLCPRGARDLAVLHHRRGDEAMVRRLRELPHSGIKFREKVAQAVRFRIEAAGDREVVRRGSALFALPANAAEGARLLWGTADQIWQALGDTSEDYNWYTKRATLSGVYGSTVLYWLGDESAGSEATWAFLERRIEDVMQIEKIKAQVNDNRVLSRLLAPAHWALGWVRPPVRMPAEGLPGTWRGPN
jgi:ubiquinone biosynthesis protein COQ9